MRLNEKEKIEPEVVFDIGLVIHERNRCKFPQILLFGILMRLTIFYFKEKQGLSGKYLQVWSCGTKPEI